MLVIEYRQEIQFKKVRKVRNYINNIPMVGSDHWYADVRRAYAQNGLYITFNNLPTIVGQQFTSYTVGVSHRVREQSLIPGEGDGGGGGGGRKEGPQKICELVREGLVKKIGTERRAIKK